MSGPFGDSSDANRKPRGPRPFAGQVHPPGSGPLKSGRVRRHTLAPFPSLAVPEPPSSVQAPEQPSALQEDSTLFAILPSDTQGPATEAPTPLPGSELPLPAAHEHDAGPPLMTPADMEQRDVGSGERPQTEPDAPTIDAFDYGDPHEASLDAFADPAEQESDAGMFTDHQADSLEETAEWTAPGHEEERPQSALYTDELRERDLEAQAMSLDAESRVESSGSGDEDDWFGQTGDVSPADDLADAPFDNIESVGESLRSLTASDGTDGDPEQLPASLPVDWAVSSEGEADLQSYVAEARIREEASDVLEGVARRVRSGEIVLALEAGASTEAVLASVLASLLT